uniref:Uncharacterized protein n=1 Tax=Rhizophora mucronata TaxID=61149 RepID=A0A2P2PTF1_RHIMU
MMLGIMQLSSHSSLIMRYL